MVVMEGSGKARERTAYGNFQAEIQDKAVKR